MSSASEPPGEPQAIAHELGRELSRELGPFVEDSLAGSMRRHPQRWIDRLAPLLGPGIARAIRNALRSLVQSLDTVLQRTLSVEGLRWRLEALRTKRPLAEIALLRSLRYRVEAVLLVHRPSGLLLCHVAHAGGAETDPQIVSAVSSAMQDFVQASFGGREDERALARMEVGDLQVLLERTELASLVAAVRGTPPESLRQELHQALLTITQRYESELRRFHGDAAPFSAVEPELSALLLEETAPRRARPSNRLRAIAFVLAIAIFAFAGWRVGYALRWHRFFATLQSTPGIVVTRTERHRGRTVVFGLRDAYAIDPRALLLGAHLSPKRVTFRFAPFLSLDPVPLAARVRALLRPPDGIEIAPEGDGVALRGHAPAAWIAKERAQARSLDGVINWREENLREDPP